MATLIKFGGNVTVKEQSANRVEASGWLVQFDKVDVDGQFFSKETDFGTDAEVITLPAMYRHGKSRYAGKRRYGSLTVTRKEEGWWCEASLDTTKPYAKQIVALLKENKLGWSSGSSDHCADFTKQSNGTDFINQWFFAEGSLTPKPAEPSNKAQIKTVKSVEALSESDELLTPESGDTSANLVTKENDEDDLKPEPDANSDKIAGAVKDAAKDAVKSYAPYSVASGLNSIAELLYLPKKFINLAAIANSLRELAALVEAGTLSAFDDDKNDTQEQLETIFKETGLSDFFAEDNDELKFATKAGRRNSNNDQKNLNAAHDAIVKAGAECGVTKSRTVKEPAQNSEKENLAETTAINETTDDVQINALKESVSRLETQLESESALRIDAENQVEQMQSLLTGS